MRKFIIRKIKRRKSESFYETRFIKEIASNKTLFSFNIGNIRNRS